MFSFTIPVDGSSVPVEDFATAAKAAVASIERDDDKAIAQAAADAAAALIKAGHIGKANVYVTVGHDAPTGLAIGVYTRPSPVVEKAAAAPPPVPPARTPYETGATPEEVLREAALTGTPAKTIAKRWGVPAPSEKVAAQAAATALASAPPAASTSTSAPATSSGPAATSGAIRHAEALGVDLAAVTPSGDRITKADVTAHHETLIANATAETSTVGASTEGQPLQ